MLKWLSLKIELWLNRSLDRFEARAARAKTRTSETMSHLEEEEETRNWTLKKQKQMVVLLIQRKWLEVQQSHLELNFTLSTILFHYFILNVIKFQPCFYKNEICCIVISKLTTREKYLRKRYQRFKTGSYDIILLRKPCGGVSYWLAC